MDTQRLSNRRSMPSSSNNPSSLQTNALPPPAFSGVPPRSATSTPMSSPGLFSPSNLRSNNPSHPNSASEVTTPLAESPSPFLHPLQTHHVRETHKALIESDIATGRKLINNYEVIEEIGRGMHGKVKLARNIQTGDNVAIKIIPRFSKTRRLGKVVAKSPQDKTKREIAILKKIRHPNVVALLEIIDDPELQKIYMVLEHVELGEIVWRKKGLPHICQYERRRIEREMRGDPITPEEEHYNQILERRQALKELKRAKMSLAYAGPQDFWSIEHGVGDDASADSGSRVPSHTDLALLDHDRTGTSMPNSLQPSRAASRTPSRSQSVRSLGPRIGPSAADERRHWLDLERDADSALRSGPNSPSVLDGTMYGPYTGEQAGFRTRSPSMADSIISHMSSLDFNAQPHDPFVDDFSYVPCFTLDQARTTFRDTVLGLEYLHYQGVVHRDIKPANLLWNRDHRVKISDFGVSYFGRPIRDGEPDDTVSESEAKDFDDDLELAKTVGTPAFFAPELCYTDPDKVQPKVSEQIDVWSLGVTLYCLIYARIPFLAEDEYQMFRKIANDPVYIPRSRLRPVDPSTSPMTTSLYKRHNSDPYRDDNELLHEDIDDLLEDLLRRMLTKDPEKRIRLKEIKRHPWVVQDIPDLIRWLDETDPARPSRGRRIQVGEEEMSRAVVPLTLIQRAKSAFRKAVTKAIHPLVERGDGKARRRATSSVASSSGDALSTAPSALQAKENQWHAEKNRPSSPHHRESPAAAPRDTPTYDPLATVLASAPYSHSSESRHVESPTPLRARISATPPPTYRSYRHAHTKSIDPSHLSTIHDNAAITDADLRSVSRTPEVRGQKSAERFPRARSADGNTFKIDTSATKRPESVSLLTRQLKPVRGGDGGVAGGSPLPSPLLFSPVAVHGYHHQHSSSDPNINDRRRMMFMDGDDRPQTARRVGTMSERRSSGCYDGQSQPGKPYPSMTGADRHGRHGHDTDSDGQGRESDRQKSVSFPTQEGMARSPTPLKKSSTSESTTTDERGVSHPSSRSASTDAVMFASPLTTPSEHRSPVSSAKTSSVNVPSDQILAFQSDPSLPALLSGASSVSADLEGELLGRPGVVDRNTPLLETTDSLTPPAMGKEPVAGFPLEESLGSSQSVDSGIIPVRGEEDTDREDDDDDDDDAGSDSDEGLTMMSHRRKSGIREPAKAADGVSKRRDTTASASSNDTARRAPAVADAI